MRRTPAVVLSTAITAALAAVTLTACTGSPAAACEPVPSGAASQSVKVEGDLGGTLTVDSAAYPLDVSTTERSTLIDGSGEPLEDGYTANLHYVLVNGSTGEVIEDSHEVGGGEPLPFVYQAGTSFPGMESALHCAMAGSRLAAVIPPAEAFGDEGVPEVGLEAGQSLLLVADVMSIEATPQETAEPLPTPAAWTSDIPAVDLATAEPTITIPDAPAPTELLLTVLEPGDGATVPNPASVTVDYVGVSWETKTIFDSSYARGSSATFSTSGVVSGFAAALVGQQVGSTVLVVIPPDLAYPGTPVADDPTDPTGRTLVFLIHIVSAE